eukprot:TRINITY_DN10064_c0_g1_i2.p1 TRINITY_DN10064_c0_g1~~TRINITY_DN10064_c0_g1_i2.p1  ORF type:complete len:352 (+),score=96.77 TRINITY_DN10064_c0_g1_i2:948-2003(+)
MPKSRFQDIMDQLMKQSSSRKKNQIMKSGSKKQERSQSEKSSTEAISLLSSIKAKMVFQNTLHWLKFFNSRSSSVVQMFSPLFRADRWIQSSLSHFGALKGMRSLKLKEVGFPSVVRSEKSFPRSKLTSFVDNLNLVGIKPDSETLDAIVEEMIEDKLEREAFELCQKILVTEKIVPKSTTLESLVHYLCLEDLEGNASRLILQAIKVSETSVDPSLVDKVIESYCRKNKVFDALLLMITLDLQGFILNSSSFVHPIRSCAEQGQKDLMKVLKLHLDTVGIEIEDVNLPELISELCEKKNVNAAICLLEFLHQLNLEVGTATVVNVVRLLQEQNQPDEASRISRLFSIHIL